MPPPRPCRHALARGPPTAPAPPPPPHRVQVRHSLDARHVGRDHEVDRWPRPAPHAFLVFAPRTPIARGDAETALACRTRLGPPRSPDGSRRPGFPGAPRPPTPTRDRQAARPRGSATDARARPGGPPPR